MKRSTDRFSLKYRDGREVREGDKVIVQSNRLAVVDAVLRPGTKEARVYDVEQVGGLLLRFDDGQVELWVCAPWWSVAEDMQRICSEGDGSDSDI